MPSFSILNRGREVFYIHCLLGWHILLHQLLINMISSRPILEGIPAEDSKHVARSCVYGLEPGQVALKASLRSLVGLLFILSSHMWRVKQQKCYPHHLFSSTLLILRIQTLIYLTRKTKELSLHTASTKSHPSPI